jgi:hypothetical protein
MAAEHVLGGTREQRTRKSRKPKLRWLQRLLTALVEGWRSYGLREPVTRERANDSEEKERKQCGGGAEGNRGGVAG